MLHYPPFPLGIVRGEGASVRDLDGHGYADFLCEYSAGLYGHSNPSIRAAIDWALDDGVVIGGPNRYEGPFAKALTERFPAVDLVRFCNSGTEANMMSLSTACAVTGRTKVLAFEGGYHGGLFEFSHGVSPLNSPLDVVLGRYEVATFRRIMKTGEELEEASRELMRLHIPQRVLDTTMEEWHRKARVRVGNAESILKLEDDCAALFAVKPDLKADFTKHLREVQGKLAAGPAGWQKWQKVVEEDIQRGMKEHEGVQEAQPRTIDLLGLTVSGLKALPAHPRQEMFRDPQRCLLAEQAAEDRRHLPRPSVYVTLPHLSRTCGAKPNCNQL